jgi:hypothetical protein
MPLPLNIPPQFQSNEPPPAWQLPHVMSPAELGVEEVGSGGWSPDFRARMYQGQRNLAADSGQQYPMGAAGMQPPSTTSFGNAGGMASRPSMRDLIARAMMQQRQRMRGR